MEKGRKSSCVKVKGSGMGRWAVRWAGRGGGSVKSGGESFCVKS